MSKLKTAFFEQKFGTMFYVFIGSGYFMGFGLYDFTEKLNASHDSFFRLTQRASLATM